MEYKVYILRLKNNKNKQIAWFTSMTSKLCLDTTIVYLYPILTTKSKWNTWNAGIDKTELIKHQHIYTSTYKYMKIVNNLCACISVATTIYQWLLNFRLCKNLILCCSNELKRESNFIPLNLGSTLRPYLYITLNTNRTKPDDVSARCLWNSQLRKSTSSWQTNGGEPLTTCAGDEKKDLQHQIWALMDEHHGRQEGCRTLKKGVRRGRWGWDQTGGGAPRFHMPPIYSE